MLTTKSHQLKTGNETTSNESTSTENEIHVINETELYNQIPEMKEGDVYLTGDNVSVNYMVDGNLFIFANDVTISSKIGGDAFVFAKTLNVTNEGNIYGNLFIIADTLNVDGIVYDIYGLTKTSTISGYIYRDIRIATDTLNIFGTIRKNAFVNCSSLSFSKTAELTDEEKTTVNSQGIINGNLNYSSSKDLSISKEYVSGDINFTPLSISSINKLQNNLINLGTLLTTVIILWLLCLVVAPKFLSNTPNAISKKILPTLGYGVLGIIILPIISFILLFINITLAVSLLILALYFILISISTSIFLISINNWVCQKFKINKNIGIFGFLILSTIVFCLIGLIPYVGGIVEFIAILLGIGTIFSWLIKRN